MLDNFRLVWGLSHWVVISLGVVGLIGGVHYRKEQPTSRVTIEDSSFGHYPNQYLK